LSQGTPNKVSMKGEMETEGGAVYIGFEELGPLGTDHEERGLGGDYWEARLN
jgi:hypothetical protein